METARADRTLIAKYETGFSVFMAVLAYLWRDNPSLVYPEVLYFLLALLALNLAAGLSLRTRPDDHKLAASFMLANCGAITGVLAFSGGPQSNLWVLYLLPVYSASLLLGPREAAWITLGAAGFNAAFLFAETDYWSAVAVFELIVKTAVLAFTAAATWRIVERDRESRRALDAKRARIQSLEASLQDQGLRLEQNDRLAQLGLLGHSVVHDLKNVFTVAIGLTGVALQNESLPVDVNDDLDRVMNAVSLGNHILSNFEELARRQSPALAPCDLHEVAQSVLALLKDRLAQHSVALDLQLQPGLPRVMGNRGQLHRLFLNLFGNAIRAMGGGGVLTIRTQAPSAEERRLRVEIEDTGPGIPAEIMANIFKPFSTTMQAQGGTGLGLYICKEIVAQHAGSIRAENKAAKGASFVLLLPAAKAAGAENGPALTASPA